MITAAELEPLLVDYLPKQRWFGAKDRAITSITIDDLELLQSGWPALAHAIVAVGFADGPTAHYQLFIGLRPDGTPAEFLHGHADAVIGNVSTNAGPAFAYDGLLDADMDLALLARIAPKEAAWRARPIGTEQSNTSIVFDDRIILKVFRRLSEGPNPDVEITAALGDHGFKFIAAPLATWSEGGHDLAVVQEYLSSGVEGWALALTSLRDLYDSPCDPADAGGDFYSEAVRLGELTAGLHGALAEALGTSPATPELWADAIDAQIAAMLPPSGIDRDALRVPAALLRAVAPGAAGAAIRVHGDFHLGQVMRTDAGWYALDFEGEPARPLEERRQPASPLKDVAGMLRSLHYAARAAFFERDQPDQDHDPAITQCAQTWEQRNRDGFLHGYTNAVDPNIVPATPEDFAVVLRAFEVEKAVYELAYEQANRPDWVPVPVSVLERLAAR